MKRTLIKSMSILIAITLLFGSLAFGFSDVDWSGLAVKAEAETLGDYTYSPYEYLGARLISVDKSISGDVIVPAYFDGQPLAYIGEDAFSNCTAIKSITLPDSVRCIWEGAFSGCTSLESVIFSGSRLIELESSVFENCTSLKSIVIPEGIKKIPYNTFYSCESLTSVTIPDSVTIIGSSAFEGCMKLEKITIPDGVTEIGSSAFVNCRNLESVTIPASVTKIGVSAFVKCENLESVTIPASVTNIGSGAFRRCDNLESITVDSENTAYSSDERGVLFNKDKTELIQYPAGNKNEIYYVPDGVTNVKLEAFICCNALETIIFPDSITEISTTAVYSCANLTCVHISKNTTNIGSYNFGKNAYICSDTENCYAKEYADANGIEFRVCTGHEAFITEPTTEPTTESTTQPVVTEPATTKPVIVPVETTTTPVTEPLTTKPVEVPTTTKPVVTEPSTTKPVEIPTTTKPVEVPITTKPTETTKPVVVTNPVETTNPEPTTNPSSAFIFKIIKPSVSTVKYGETLILHTNLTSISADEKIEWSVDGEGVTIKPSADGLTCAVTSTATGDVTITAKYTDANGVEHVSEQEIESNASFWQKIVSFFKNLFGINRIIEQVIKF